MTLARKIAAVEALLTPTELIVCWLDEAHSHAGLEAYVRSQLADGDPLPPLDRLARAASDGVRASLKGQPRELIAKAAESGVFQAVFRYELVLRINTLGHELIERQAMLNAICGSQLGMLASGLGSQPTDPLDARRFLELLALTLDRIVELRAHEQARRQVEARFLGGHLALFPDDQAAWVERIEHGTDLAGFALRLAELEGIPGDIGAPDPEPSAERVAAIAASFVEPAKASAFEVLGDGRRAYRTAGAWLRSVLEA